VPARTATHLIYKFHRYHYEVAGQFVMGTTTTDYELRVFKKINYSF